MKLQLDNEERSDSLLQVASTNKTSLFCLRHAKPTEMRFINNMNGLMRTNTFVDMHLNSTMSRVQPVLWDQINTNPSGSLVLHTQYEDWSGTQIEERLLD